MPQQESTVPASDSMRARIGVVSQARGGGVAVHQAGRGSSLLSKRIGAPLARLRPTGDADTRQALWWSGLHRSASGPFGVATMPPDAALD